MIVNCIENIQGYNGQKPRKIPHKVFFFKTQISLIGTGRPTYDDDDGKDDL